MASLGSVPFTPIWGPALTGRLTQRSNIVQVSGLATNVIVDLWTDAAGTTYPMPGIFLGVCEMGVKQSGVSELTVLGRRKIYSGRFAVNSALTDGQLAAVGFGTPQTSWIVFYWAIAQSGLLKKGNCYFSA